MARVLVVDDDPGLRRLLRTVLSLSGHEVILAENGLEGLERLRHERPQVIVLDLMMPVMDGTSFLQELDLPHSHDAEFRKPAVIVVSAYGNESAARALGATAALKKPFDPESLVYAIELCLGADDPSRNS